MIDLHIHTTASDGSDSPFDLVCSAAKAGFRAIAITDHDTIDGVFEALCAGKSAGIEVIPGVELSCDWDRELHVVGLYINPKNPKLIRTLEELAMCRVRRNQKTLLLLRKMGISITEEEVRQVATGNIWGRAHFAKILCDKGYVASVKEGFQKYFGFGRPAYVNEERLSPEEAIAVIRAAGGIPILAHMHYLKLDFLALKELLLHLKQAGLMGAEVIYSEYTPVQTLAYTALIEELHLLKSGGSDYHGVMKPHILLTPSYLNIPYSFLKEMKPHVRTF